MDYRREIDGLRALAVVPVILFHAGFQTVGGGFVGVDVFFVISGYLITSILAAEMQTGSFSLLNFYERRARRILPALFFVMLVCLPFAWLWLMPADMKSFSNSLLAVSSFASNVLFWTEVTYFEPATELKPLLHTWSLAVEEQYYVFFPLFLMAAWRLGRRWVMLLLLLAALASLALCQWASLNMPEAAFYLLPTRAWELLIGALVALALSGAAGARRNGPLAEGLSLAGLLMIVYAILAFDRNTPFPGFYALVPTVGAALIIYFASPANLAGKLLGTPAMVGVGLVSYSAYLWHQPLFAFAKHRSLAGPDALMLGALALLSLGLAWLTWKYVEKPFRSKGRVSRAQIFSFGLAGTALFVACGLAGNLQGGFSNRFDPQLTALFAPAKTGFQSDCVLTPYAAEPMLKKCEFGSPEGDKVFFLYGDSHAQALFSALDVELKRRRIKGIFVANDNCQIPQVFDSRVKTAGGACGKAAQTLYKWLAAEADYLAVSLRWTYRLYPVPGAIDSLVFDNGESGVEHGDTPRENYTLLEGRRSNAAAGKSAAIHAFIENAASGRKQFFLVYPIPEVGWDLPRVNFRSYLATGDVDSVISTSFDAYRKRNAFIEEVLNQVPERDNMTRIRPAGLLCDTGLKGRCLAQANKVALYYDDDHLSNAGATVVISEIMKQLEKESARPRGASS